MAKDQGVVHVVGTGTIGEPLIGLLCSFKDQAGWSEVTFHKRSPVSRDLPKLHALMSRGAKLVVDEDRVSDFEAIGLCMANAVSGDFPIQRTRKGFIRPQPLFLEKSTTLQSLSR